MRELELKLKENQVLTAIIDETVIDFIINLPYLLEFVFEDDARRGSITVLSQRVYPNGYDAELG